MKEIYFVTSNKGKIETLKKYFQDTDIIIKNVSTNYEEPYVNNIEYIAKEKVLEGYKQLNKPCISLDAGSIFLVFLISLISQEHSLKGIY